MRWATTASCTCTAPLGLPVVPLVKCSSAGSSGRIGTVSNRSDAPSSRPIRSRVRSGRSGSSSSRTTSTCSRKGSDARMARHFLRVETGGGDQRFALPDGEPSGDRLRPEGREQRRDHAAALECAEDGDVQLGYAPSQDEYAIAVRNAQARKYVGKAAGGQVQIGVGEVPHRALATQPAQGELSRPRPARVPTHRLMSDVERAPSAARPAAARAASQENCAHSAA